MYRDKISQRTIKIGLSLAMILTLAVVGILCAEEPANSRAFKNLNLKEAKIFNLQGDIQVKGPGRGWRTVKKSTLLKADDRVGIGEESYLELYFDNRRDVVFKFFGRAEILLKDIPKIAPKGFELSVDPKTKVSQVILFFKPESFYQKYAQELIELKIPYTFVNVSEGAVDVDGLRNNKPFNKSVLVPQEFSTYVFEGRPPFPPSPGNLALEVCVQNCSWGTNGSK